MGINFPSTPTIGQLWPQPAVAGVPVWRWDGFAWIATGVSSLTGAVRYDIAQTLTSAQAAQARSNILAAPIANPSANLLINGDMSISQENGTTAIAPVNNAIRYIADQWVFAPYQVANTAMWSVAQGLGSAYPGLTALLGMTAVTAWSAGNASDAVTLYQPVEGQRWAKLGWGTANASPVSFGFWVAATIAGTLTLSIRNSPVNRSYVTAISILGGAAWQYKTVTIPGDVAGTWATDTGMGVSINFCLGCGATNTTPNSEVWQAGNFLAKSGITNFFASNNNQFYLAGVSLIPGSTPVPLEQSAAIRRDPAEELRLCQRYWEVRTATVYAYIATAGTTAMMIVPFIEKRVSPFASIASSISSTNATAPAIFDTTTTSCMVGANAIATGIVSLRGAVIVANARM
jgi:hypothetical protein